MRTNLLNRLALVAMTALSCHTASAALINNNTGLASPAKTITFGTNDFPPHTTITTEYSASGLANAGGLTYDNTSFSGVFNNTAGAYLVNFNDITGAVSAPFTITFGSALTSVAFVLVSDVPITLTAMLGGTTVESDAVSSNTTFTTADFYGFSGITFDRIRFSASGDFRVFIDTLELGTAADVPEPSSIALGAIGLIGIVASRRRRTAR